MPLSTFIPPEYKIVVSTGPGESIEGRAGHFFYTRGLAIAMQGVPWIVTKAGGYYDVEIASLAISA
jgi:hypothetical protein